MEYYSRPVWVDVSQKFFEAYINFRLEGTTEHCIEHNGREIKLSFYDESDYVLVIIGCSKIFREMDARYDGSSRNTEEIIRKILWFALDAEELEVYTVKASNTEEENKELSDLLAEKYRRCYDRYCCSLKEYWKPEGEESFIIELHDRQIHVWFYPEGRWEELGYICASLYCLDTDNGCLITFSQTGDGADYLIRLIQDLSLEPEIIELNITDFEKEHNLIREALVGKVTERGLHRERVPFAVPCYIWEGDKIQDKFLNLHNRSIRIQFIPKAFHIDIIISCLTTGKTNSLSLPKDGKYEEINEICEEMVYKIQELAWEVT